MTVTSLSLPAQPMQLSRTPEAMEGSKSDRDGDKDDRNVATAASAGVSASAPKGMGVAVDTRA
jgi:hypothetical protein